MHRSILVIALLAAITGCANLESGLAGRAGLGAWARAARDAGKFVG